MMDLRRICNSSSATHSRDLQLLDPGSDPQFSCQRKEPRRAEITNNWSFSAIPSSVFWSVIFCSEPIPNLNEGQLSKLKGFFVSSANLVKYAERIHLGNYLQLGKGEEKTGGRTKQALLVDAFEAVLGAIYLDGGIEEARRVMLRFFEPQIEDVGDSDRQLKDFKTELQEQLQAQHLGRAEYIVASEDGPDHQKLFTVEVMIDGESVAHGVGLTKKAAEQAAHGKLLERVWSRTTTETISI